MDGYDKKHPEWLAAVVGHRVAVPGRSDFAVAASSTRSCISVKPKGAEYLTPTGREVLPYVPPMVSRKVCSIPNAFVRCRVAIQIRSCRNQRTDVRWSERT